MSFGHPASQMQCFATLLRWPVGLLLQQQALLAQSVLDTRSPESRLKIGQRFQIDGEPAPVPRPSRRSSPSSAAACVVVAGTALGGVVIIAFGACGGTVMSTTGGSSQAEVALRPGRRRPHSRWPSK